MESTNLWQVTHGKGSIIWEPHRCAGDVVSAAVSPVATWLSLGFSAVAAGASVYSAYKLSMQEKQLDAISRDLACVNGKLDGIKRDIDRIHRTLHSIETLTRAILDDIRDVKDATIADVFISGSQQNFRDKVRNGSVSLEALTVFANDIATALSEISGNGGKRTGDILIPNWIIDQARPIHAFLSVLNIHLVETHNRLNSYDASMVRRLCSLSEQPVLLTESIQSDEDAHKNRLLQIHGKYSRAPESQPRLKWLYAYLWEIRLAEFALATSRALSGDDRDKLAIPQLDESLLAVLLDKKAA